MKRKLVIVAHAQKELKQRVEDAVAATRAAMEEGIVPGGGIALYNVFALANDTKVTEPIEEAARAILMKALRAPIEAIITNSGESVSKVMGDLKNRGTSDTWKGFNGITNKIGDLKEAGIIDPLKVTKTAFTNAVSVASTYLTVGAAVTNIPEKKESAGGMGMGGGMPGMGGMGMGDDY